MTSPDTPSALASLIVVDGAIPSVIAPQSIAGQIPVEARTLAAHERENAGLSDPGVTLAYKMGRTEVFLDLGGAHATVWFQGGDSKTAIGVFEAALKQRFPQAHYLGQESNVGDPGMIVRQWRVQSPDGGMVAELRATFPGPSAALASRELFLVRVFALRRGAIQ
jgi:hypothetical protein